MCYKLILLFLFTAFPKSWSTVLPTMDLFYYTSKVSIFGIKIKREFKPEKQLSLSAGFWALHFPGSEQETFLIRNPILDEQVELQSLQSPISQTGFGLNRLIRSSLNATPSSVNNDSTEVTKNKVTLYLFYYKNHSMSK